MMNPGDAVSQPAYIFIITWIWLAACAILDWQKGEVPNWLTMPGMVSGIVYAAVFHPERLTIVIIAFITLLGLFLLHVCGRQQ